MKNLETEVEWDSRFNLIPSKKSEYIKSLEHTGASKTEILTELAKQYAQLINSMPRIENIPKLPNTPENNFYVRILQICQTLHDRGERYTPTFIHTFAAEIEQVVDRIRNRKAYSLLDLLVKKERELILTDFDRRTIYSMPVGAVYTLVCRREKFLVCAKPNPTWRDIYLREDSEQECQKQYEYIHSFITPRIHQLEPSLLPVIPRYFIRTDDLETLSLPQSVNTVEESLEEAFYRKRYIVPPEGAEIHIDHAGDLQGFRLMERGSMLWATAITNRGDHLMGLDLDSAQLDTKQFRRFAEQDKIEDLLARILAEVYRDLVTSVDVERPRGSKRLIKLPQKEKYKEILHARWIFIPRKRILRTGPIHMDNETEFVRHAPIPHKVVGFKRKGNITESHRREIIKFEKETGINILDYLPEGYTFVRPHTRPKDTLEVISSLPKFLKKKIERELK